MLLRLTLTYAATAATFLGLDYLWLSTTAGAFYRPRLGALLLDSPRIGIAALFYIFYSAAVVILAVTPANAQENGLLAFGLGAVLGAAAYGTYDITNLSTLRGWSVEVTIVDILWGTLLSGLAATAGYFAAKAAGGIGG